LKNLKRQVTHKRRKAVSREDLRDEEAKRDDEVVESTAPLIDEPAVVSVLLSAESDVLYTLIDDDTI